MSNRGLQMLQDAKDLVGLGLWLALLQSPIILTFLLIKEFVS